MLAGGELTMPQHTCGMPQDEPHKVLSIAAVVVVGCCCLVSLLCAYFHSNIYSCKTCGCHMANKSNNTLTKSVQIPLCVSLFIPLFLCLPLFSEISPYLDLALCPIRAEPWSCARQKTARVLDLWDDELQVQWQKLKGESSLIARAQVKEVLIG